MTVFDSVFIATIVGFIIFLLGLPFVKDKDKRKIVTVILIILIAIIFLIFLALHLQWESTILGIKDNSSSAVASTSTTILLEPSPTPTRVKEQGIECMSYDEAQEHFPGISSDIIIPIDINDIADYTVAIDAKSYKRYSWHIYNDGQKHNFGTTGNNVTYGTCCASYYDTDGTQQFLVKLNAEYFWLKDERVTKQ